MIPCKICCGLRPPSTAAADIPPPALPLAGIVLCSLKTIYNKKLQVGDQRVKTSRVDSHVVCASAGLAADAMVLVKDCRVRDRRDRKNRIPCGLNSPPPPHSPLQALGLLKYLIFGLDFLFPSKVLY